MHLRSVGGIERTDLRARPMFHRTRDAIKAHLRLRRLAIARYLQDATGPGIRKIVRTYRPIQQITVLIAGHTHLARHPP